MVDTTGSGSLSGPGAPPFYGPPTPPPSGSFTIMSSPIHGPTATRTIGPDIIELTETGTDATQALTFAAAGTQTITQPPEATLCVIKPPAANTVALKLQGAGDTTGVPISPSLPSVIAFPTTVGGATFQISAAAAVTGAVEVAFA